MIEDLNYIDPTFMKQKYTPFRAWKWYCFLFEFTLMSEIIITIFFWTVLNNPGLYIGDYLHDLVLRTDHIVPLSLLFIDYCFNTVPFCFRHLSIVYIIGAIYLSINCIASLSRGNPIYPPLDWTKPIGYICLGGFVVGFALVFTILKFITDFKLIKNGYGAIVNSQKDRLHLRKTTDLGALAKEKDAFGVYNHYQPSRLQSVNVPTAMDRNNPFMAA